MAAPTPETRGIPRGRLVALVAVAALVAAAVVGLAALATDDGAPAAATETTPSATIDPLPGRPLIALPPAEGMPADPAERLAWAERRAAAEPGPDSALMLAAAQVAAGDGAAAQATLAAVDDPRAAVASALAGYDPADPTAAIDRLRGLADAAPADAFARFSHGVALLWSGRRADAEAELRAVRDAEPEGFYGVAADDLLHPQLPPGYPPFIPAEDAGTEDPDALAERAAANPDDPQAQVAYGAALIAEGRRREAVAAFDAALAVDPGLVEARVGRIVAGFSKDEPAVAFGQMGPLVRDHPANPSPRLHLALMLLWLRDPDTARAQLRQVAEQHPGTRLGDAAERFLAAL